ncbi:MAG: DUF5666 domain-containing protein [Solirubrobacterales bacterium]
MITKRVSLLMAISVLAATATVGALALPAQAALRHIDGTVLSKNAANRTFRITTQSGNRLRVKVNSATKFQRIAGGFGGLHKGLRVEVDAKSTANGLLATQVETRRGGGGGADDNGGSGGSDDGPNHT